jgi:zinc transporter 1/2/3
MSIFALFFVELMTMRYAKFGHGHGEHHGHTHGSRKGLRVESEQAMQEVSLEHGEHLATRDEARDDDVRSISVMEPYAAQLTGVFILEFGVIFHSIFIGLTLAVAGAEFSTLYVVLVFHQTFEGLALGSRFASIDWPKTKRWTPYILGTCYALSTPIAIAIGLGVRSTYHPGSATALITNGVFDSISAGILIYTGLVELMAHDFIFSSHMQRAPVRETLYAFGTMCCGAGLMALLGKWA